MRNDLDKACVGCQLRLPSKDAVCPRCAVATVPAGDALRALRERRVGMEGWLDVPRTLALYVPMALGLLAALVIDGFFLKDQILASPRWSPNALGIGVGALAGLSAFGLFCLLLAVPWFLWAGLVSLVFLVYRHVSSLDIPPPLLAPLALPSPLRPTFLGRAVRRLGEVAAKLDAWHQGKPAPNLLVPLLVLVAAMVIADVFAATPTVEFKSLKAFGNSAGPLLIMLIPVGVVTMIVMLFPLWVATRATERITAALRKIETRRRMRVGQEISLETLQSKRTRARGRASRGPKPLLTAPISGKPCLAFRLVGHLDDIAVDDGEAIPMILTDGAEKVEVRGDRFALSLAGPGEKTIALVSAPAERIPQFFTARGIAVKPVMADLQEFIVQEGDEIEAWGAVREEKNVGEGYRDVVLGRVLDDADGRPVLVTR